MCKPSSDPVPPSTSQYRFLLTQYHHISTCTAPYWPSTTKYQPVPTYTVVAWGLQTSGQFTPGPGVVLLDLALADEIKPQGSFVWNQFSGGSWQALNLTGDPRQMEFFQPFFFVADFHPKMFRDAALIIIHLHNVCLSIPSLEVTWVPILSLDLPCLDFLCELIT